MAGGGGKGGSQTTEMELPGWVEDAARQNLTRADDISRIGYVPYSGPAVAAFTPQQLSAMQGVNQAANAFGLPGSDLSGIPEAQTFAGGVRGYSSAPLYEQSIAQLQADRPGQYQAITNQFVDPVTGQMATSSAGSEGGKGGLQPTGNSSYDQFGSVVFGPNGLFGG